MDSTYLAFAVAALVAAACCCYRNADLVHHSTHVTDTLWYVDDQRRLLHQRTSTASVRQQTADAWTLVVVLVAAAVASRWRHGDSHAVKPTTTRINRNRRTYVGQVNLHCSSGTAYSVYLIPGKYDGLWVQQDNSDVHVTAVTRVDVKTYAPLKSDVSVAGMRHEIFRNVRNGKLVSVVTSSV